MTVRRGDENTFHTSLEDMEVTQPMSDVDIVNLRSQLEQQLATWSQVYKILFLLNFLTYPIV